MRQTLKSLGVRGVGLAALLSMATISLAAPAVAEDLVVEYDQAQLLRLPEPAADIIIGNSAIADVNLQSKTLMVITGKTFGVTNLIILNKEGKIMINQRVMVRAPEQKVVRVMRGTAKETYNCLPKCEPIVKLGDNIDFMGSVIKSAQQKNGYAGGEGGGGSGGGNSGAN